MCDRTLFIKNHTQRREIVGASEHVRIQRRRLLLQNFYLPTHADFADAFLHDGSRSSRVSVGTEVVSRRLHCHHGNRNTRLFITTRDFTHITINATAIKQISNASNQLISLKCQSSSFLKASTISSCKSEKCFFITASVSVDGF